MLETKKRKGAKETVVVPIWDNDAKTEMIRIFEAHGQVGWPEHAPWQARGLIRVYSIYSPFIRLHYHICTYVHPLYMYIHHVCTYVHPLYMYIHHICTTYMYTRYTCIYTIYAPHIHLTRL